MKYCSQGGMTDKRLDITFDHGLHVTSYVNKSSIPAWAKLGPAQPQLVSPIS